MTTPAKDSPHVRLTRVGEGPPLVLVHGLGSRHQVWDPVVGLLAASYDVIAVDLPGFGESEPDPRFAPGPRGYADFLTDVLADQGVERPHVAGNSMGGSIALELGRRGLASSVTAFSPAGFWKVPGRRWAQGLLTGLRAVAGAAEPLLPRIAASGPGRYALLGSVIARPARLPVDDVLLAVDGLMTSPSFPAARASFDDYDLVGVPQDWGALTSIPVTVAWGTRDYLLTHRTQSRRARSAMPFARHLDLPGCGHVPFADDPDRCVASIVSTTSLSR